jgi:3-methyladenine DNA glycosylase/8-oxoguanine DNA glycosylase
VEVRLDDIDRVGLAIDAAATGGATTITGIRFDVRNRAALERDALRQAVADARARADAAAAGANATIDRIMRIEEEVNYEPPRPMMRMADARAVERDARRRSSRRRSRIQSRVTTVTFDPLKRRGFGDDGRRHGARAARAHAARPVLRRSSRNTARAASRPAARQISFCGLVEAIVSQQLSTRAAATIYGRVRACCRTADATPEGLLPLSDEALRGAGLSRQKLGYMRDLSRKMLDGSINTAGLQDMSDDEIVAELTKIKGIGALDGGDAADLPAHAVPMSFRPAILVS